MQRKADFGAEGPAPREPFEFAFLAYRRPGRALVAIRNGLFGATVVASDASLEGEIPLDACFEAFAAALARSGALGGTAFSMARWIERRPECLFRGRVVPEAWFEVKMRWDAKASRYRDPRWRLLRRDELEAVKAMLEGGGETLAA